ncbi:MAG: DNA repair protein RecO [Paludibacteraceae bacterium]
MQSKTVGVILHQIKYTDSSGIVSIYTREFGRVSYVVRGAYKKKSTCRTALLQPLSLVEVDVHHNPKKEIQTIKDIRISVPFFQIPYHPVKNGVALFMAELLHKTLKHSERDEDLYQFIENSIAELDTCSTGIGNFHLVFMSGLAKKFGFTPDISNGKDFSYFDMMNGTFESVQPPHVHFLKEEPAKTFRQILEMDYDSLSSFPMNRLQRMEVLQNFVEYYKLHLADFQSLKSVEVLHKLWE